MPPVEQLCSRTLRQKKNTLAVAGIGTCGVSITVSLREGLSAHQADLAHREYSLLMNEQALVIGKIHTTKTDLYTETQWYNNLKQRVTVPSSAVHYGYSDSRGVSVPPPFPNYSLPLLSIHSSFSAWLWSLPIRSGHRLISHPRGIVGLQQSEGSTLPQTYCSLAWQPECHARREGVKKPLALGPLSAYGRSLGL